MLTLILYVNPHFSGGKWALGHLTAQVPVQRKSQKSLPAWWRHAASRSGLPTSQQARRACPLTRTTTRAGHFLYVLIYLPLTASLD